MELHLEKEIESLTKKLVSINSVCPNESVIAKEIENYLRNINYFADNPNQVLNFDCSQNRNSVISYIKGKGKKTVILMGHIDTVDIKDYGKAAKYALNPDKLKDKLKEYFTLSKDVLEDIESNNYMFARGALDMKAGVAAYMCVFKYFADHLDELEGNLLLLCECDEEGNSSGVVKALDVLADIRKKEGFEYVACINGDYSTSNDLNRNIYLGTVGKLLPCFVAIGKESHVGNPFSGLDPNLLLSLINKNISLNIDLVDEYEGKTNVPAICLKQCDNKDSYSVQTASSAMSYFNYMIYNSTCEKVLNNCLKIAKDSFNECIELLNVRYKQFCNRNKIKFTKLPFKCKVFSYKTWTEMLSENPDYLKDIEKYKQKLLLENPNIDIRDFAYKVVLKSYDYYQTKEPVIIVMFASTFYSPCLTKDEKLIDSIKKAIKSIDDTKYHIQTANFYPYISDMSFLFTSLSDKQVEEMKMNCPFVDNYPYEKIKSINVPVVNIGTYGKDGHTYSERLEKDYSFREMPNLVYKTIIEYFKG